MAVGKLSPRQKMINMMYLVLTALLALNVSKEVLNSFFEVNQGIEVVTESLKSKSAETYAAFDAAAEFNEVKAGPYKEKAYSVKDKADSLVAFIQEMKYNLVLLADKKVYLGLESEFRDAEGDFIEGSEIVKEWKDLSPEQKLMNIGALSRKDDRNSSGDLFYSDKRKKNIATDLKGMMLVYKDFLISAAKGNPSLINSINETYTFADKKGKKGDPSISWEEYNFYDMPSVGALTLLSNMQLTARNAEADVINMLMEKIDAKSLKFTSAEGIQIPQSNFVLRGDSFRAQIFISAKDTTQEPEIYVGEVEYDSLGGKYEMVGDYDTIKVLNGKGMFAERTSSEGVKKWGGLIKMKITANTFKYYPFKGEYLVAAKNAVVSPTKMNIFYIGLESIGGNPIQVSVPGYTASEITPTINNGTIKIDKKSEGKYRVLPKTVGDAIVSLYANVDGKRTKMGEVKFRVRKPPLPSSLIASMDANGRCDRVALKNDIVQSVLEDFEFDGLKYVVTGFKLSGTYKSSSISKEQENGMDFTNDMKTIITNSSSGSTINISKIKAKLIGSTLPPDDVEGDIVIEIK